MNEVKKSIIINCLKGKYSALQIANLFRYIFGRKGPIVPWQPLYLTIFTTYRCNLSCDMCLTHSQRHDNLYGQKPCKDMDFKTFKEVLNKYNKALVVALIGNGEPLLNKDFFRMAEYASKTRYVFCTTNGTSMDQYREQLLASGLDLLIISINGHTEEEYMRMTGEESKYFQLVIKNTKGLINLKMAKKQKRPKIWVSFIIDKKNYASFREMIDFAVNLGVEGVLFLPFMPSPKDGFRAEERCLFSDNKGILDKINSVKKSGLKTDVVFPALIDRRIFEKIKKDGFCKAPFYNMTIDGEGNIGGCSCQLLDNTGNGKFYDGDAWNNFYFQQFRSRFIDEGVTIPEPCSRCHNNLPKRQW